MHALLYQIYTLTGLDVAIEFKDGTAFKRKRTLSPEEVDILEKAKKEGAVVINIEGGAVRSTADELISIVADVLKQEHKEEKVQTFSQAEESLRFLEYFNRIKQVAKAIKRMDEERKHMEALKASAEIFLENGTGRQILRVPMEHPLALEIRESNHTEEQDEDGQRIKDIQNKRSRILRNIAKKENLGLNLIEALLSHSVNKKVVLAFDKSLEREFNGKPLWQFLDAIRELKRNPSYKKILENLEIIQFSPDDAEEKLTGCMEGENTELFIFAQNKDRAHLESFQENAHYAFMDESDFPDAAEYPLAEIVTITLVRSVEQTILSPGVNNILTARNGRKLDLSRINIESITLEENGVLLFQLLPEAEKVGNDVLIKQYAALKRILKSA